MKKKRKMTILILTAAIAIGGGATYLFTIGPLAKPVLAVVNGENIPVARFQEELGKTDPAARDLVKENPGKLLDVIINRTLLLQQAKKEGTSIPKGGSATPPAAGGDAETETIMIFLDKKMAALPPVTTEEIDRIYEVYKDQMGGRKKEETATMIKQMIEQQRQSEEGGKLIADLRKNAKIDVNQNELQKLAVVTPGLETQSEADFRKALSGGKPMVVDFGSNSCIPCRQLRPVRGALLTRGRFHRYRREHRPHAARHAGASRGARGGGAVRRGDRHRQGEHLRRESVFRLAPDRRSDRQAAG